MSLKSRKTNLLVLIFLFAQLLANYTLATPVKLPDSYPMTMTFRATNHTKPNSKEFKRLLDDLKFYDWIHAPGLNQKFDITRKTYPNKIITRQEAYGGISEPSFSKVWPGHLLYKVGTLLTKDLSSDDQAIIVEDQSRIVKNKKKVNQENKKHPSTITIYALDETGRPDWSKAEHLHLKAVNGQKIIVERGQWGTTPLSFKAGKAVVAKHMMFWNQQWQLNLSLDSPRGGVGNLTAAEWYAKFLFEKIPNDESNGIELDVGRWTWGYPAENAMDANNDLVADYGYINGVNSFGLGGQILFREMRKIAGNDKIIQVDSNDAMYGIRGWRYLNGIQMEAFPAMSDYNRFSQAFLHLRLWADNAEESPKVSYPFTKAPTTVFSNNRLPDGSKTDFRFRVGFASACLLGLPHAFASIQSVQFDPANSSANDESGEQFGVFKWDEYHGGDLNDWHWLGRPLGLAKQELSALDKTDLLAKTAWQWHVDNGFKAEIDQGKTFSADVKQIPNGVLPEMTWTGTRLAPKNADFPSLIPDREYTLEFEARGDDTWRYAGQTFDHVPRMVTISGSIATRTNKPLSFLADSIWRTYRISFIADASHLPTPTFGVSEQVGKTEIRNIKLFAGGAERWSREFEKGMVLLNMTKDPWRVQVRKNYYKRLKGNQAPEINNGQLIENEVVVPPRDAVFLAKR